MKKIIFLSVLFLFPLFLKAQTNKGERANLVCFVRFADEESDIFKKEPAFYDSLFNDEDESSLSVYNYYRQASYKQLNWKSLLYPLAAEQKIVSYQAKMPRAYYQHKTDDNSDGYDASNAADALFREQSLVQEICEYLDSIIPSIENIDRNNDGYVDNLCLIISGDSAPRARYMLWPHRSTLYIKQAAIRGKNVGEYVIVFADKNGPKPENQAAVLCHEMSHTLGTRDLYRPNGYGNAIGVWDILSDFDVDPQGMSAYTKYKYCKWIDEIPEISAPGTYTLNPVAGASKENIAYKIKPLGSEEYFVLEYRKKEGPFDVFLPSSGLLIYRINPNFTGNDNYDGENKLDEQYLFRKGGTINEDGDIDLAPFSAESGRTAFGGSAQQKPFYANGKRVNFAINNVSSAGETISFDLLPFAPQILLSQSTLNLGGKNSKDGVIEIQTVNTAWKIKNVPDWLKLNTTEGSTESTKLTLAIKEDNTTAEPRTVKLRIESVDDSSVFAELSVVQHSDLPEAPHALEAKIVENGIELSWKSPLGSALVLSEDFEKEANIKLWSIVTTKDSVGWVWQKTEKHKLAYEGQFSARLNSDMQDKHQDEWLISPVFSDGSVLEFYSKSIAPGKSNPNHFYYVKISKDGGETWEQIYDLKTESSVVNQYELISIDISSYLSDNMRIAFHAYDNGVIPGLAYWWHVDNITVLAKKDGPLVKEYHIFRNGEKIGASNNETFLDKNPTTGLNSYTIKAVGDFGETALSDALEINFTPSFISKIEDEKPNFFIKGKELIVSDNLLEAVFLYNLQATLLYKNIKCGSPQKILIESLPSGTYILKTVSNKKVKVSKIIVPHNRF